MNKYVIAKRQAKRKLKKEYKNANWFIKPKYNNKELNAMARIEIKLQKET